MTEFRHTVTFGPPPAAPLAEMRAGLPVRAGALLIDGIVGVALAIVVGLVIGDPYGESATTATGSQTRYGVSLQGAQLTVAVLAWFAYQIACEATRGATLGKRVVGLRVVRRDGAPVGVGAAVGRNLTHVIAVVVLPLVGAQVLWPSIYLAGAIVALLSPYRQRLGDHLAGTVVVRSSNPLP